MTDWHEHAPCRGMSIDVFFPEEAGSPDWGPALVTCARCPATGPDGPCVAEGEALGDWHGFRGGLTPQERAKMAKRNRLRRTSVECNLCGRFFPATVGGARFCSHECRQAARRASYTRYDSTNRGRAS